MADTPQPCKSPASLSPARISVRQFPPPPPPPTRIRRLYERFVRWGQFSAPTSPGEALAQSAADTAIPSPPPF